MGTTIREGEELAGKASNDDTLSRSAGIGKTAGRGHPDGCHKAGPVTTA